MEDTYLDADAMLRRIEKMRTEAEDVYKTLTATEVVMEKLKKYFMGESANRLQSKFADLASTYKELLNYLNSKADAMRELTANVTAADEGN